MAKYYLTNKAVQDLSEIWDYTHDEWSENQADKYYNFLLESCQEVANNRKFGKAYDEIEKDLLGFKCNHHNIFFKVISGTQIEVERILHEKMDLKSKF